MSVPVSVAICEPSSPVGMLQSVTATDASFDVRWAAWVERGRQRDIAAKRTLRIVLPCTAAVAVLVVIVLRVAAGAP